MERLQKFMSRCGVASRRGAEVMILSGHVSVNGETVEQLGTKVAAGDIVLLDGKRICPIEEKIYLLLNKPRGYITSLKDPQGRKTVVDLVQDVPQRVYPVGRLDYETEGLLLMTNDGDLTFALTHPRHEIKKTYHAQVKGVPSEEQLDRLRHGLELDDGMTAPARVDLLHTNAQGSESLLEITIHEGRNRQVRRMFETIGHPVKALRRIRMAFLDLKGLECGQYRLLSRQEVERLQKVIAQNT